MDRVHRRVVGSLSLLISLLAACGDDSRPPADGSGTYVAQPTPGGQPAGGQPAASTDPTPTPPPATSSACSDRASEGPDVATMRVQGTAPTPSGGTIEPGKYLLTSYEEYFTGSGEAGATGHTLRSVLEIEGDRMTFTSHAACHPSENEATKVRAEAFTVANATVTSEEECPTAHKAYSRGYTYAGGVLTFFEDFGGFVRRLDYTKQ